MGSRGPFVSREDLHISAPVSNCICVQQKHKFELLNKNVAEAYILFIHGFVCRNVS